jgi:hypothetical protein
MAITRFTERRHYKRYPVRGGILVSTPSRIGELLDISMGGLSFRQIDRKELPEDYESAILFGEDEFFLEDIPMKLIGDYTEEIPFGYRQIRRVGASFGELGTGQKERLRDFIQIHSR